MNKSIGYAGAAVLVVGAVLLIVTMLWISQADSAVGILKRGIYDSSDASYQLILAANLLSRWMVPIGIVVLIIGILLKPKTSASPKAQTPP